MKKLIAKSQIEQGIIDGIERKSKEIPAILNLERFKETNKNAYRVKAAILSWDFDLKLKNEAIQKVLKSISIRKQRHKTFKAIESKQKGELSGRAKGRYTMRRNQAMKAMIIDGVWSKKLAEVYDISRNDVQIYHTKEMRIIVFLNTSTHDDFKAYLFDKGVKAFEAEKQKLENYQEEAKVKTEKRLLRKLLAFKKFQVKNKPPRFLIEEKLYSRNEEGKSKIEILHDELDAYHTRAGEHGEREWLHKGKEISQHEYKKGRDVSKNKLRKLQEEHEKLYRIIFLDNEANDNMTYIKAIGFSDLQRFISQKEQFDRDTTGIIKEPFKGMGSIRVTSVGQGEKLIKEYCSWYNKKFKAEIKAAKDENEKERIARKNEKNRLKSKIKKLDRDRKIIELRESGEKNAVRIANEVGEKKRTVREILARYDEVVELYRRGVTIPEVITEQKKTKLSTVVLYLEILTGESIDSKSLKNEQQQQLELARQKEAEAREEMEEKEFRRLERKSMNFWKIERKNKIVQLHTNGWNPSYIQKNVNVTVAEIKSILKEHGLTPHFDWRLASDEERDEELEKRRIKEQETLKRRKKIDL